MFARVCRRKTHAGLTGIAAQSCHRQVGMAYGRRRRRSVRIGIGIERWIKRAYDGLGHYLEEATGGFRREGTLLQNCELVAASLMWRSEVCGEDWHLASTT